MYKNCLTRDGGLAAGRIKGALTALLDHKILTVHCAQKELNHSIPL